MAADPSTIPASAIVTNITVEPLQVAGLKAFAVGEVRTVNLAAFALPQRSIVWNALYNALAKNLITAPAVTFDVNELATGHQAIVNRGGHGVGGSTVSVPGGLSLPSPVTFTNLVAEPLVLVGVHLPVAATGAIDLSLLPINQQATVWDALILARDKGLISSPELTTAVQAGFTGHQGVENGGGHGPGGQITFLLQTPYVGITFGGVPLTVQGEDITVQGL